MHQLTTTAARRPGVSADAAAITAAIAVAALGLTYGLASGASAALPVQPRLHGTTRELVSIATRNIAVCGALVLAAHAAILRTRWPRNVIDVFAFVVLVPTSFLVAMIAGHPGGTAYLPHAPLELAAIALSAAWWWRHHKTPPDWLDTRGRLCLVTALLLLAALLETFLVPHR